MNNFEDEEKKTSRKHALFRPHWRHPKSYIIIGLVVVAVICMSVAIFTSSRKSVTEQPNQSNDLTQLRTTEQEESTQSTYAYILSSRLEVFADGDTTRDPAISGTGYYPSTEQVNDPIWAKENLNVNEKMLDFLKNSTLKYTAKNCKDNQCDSYTIQVNDEVVSPPSN